MRKRKPTIKEQREATEVLQRAGYMFFKVKSKRESDRFGNAFSIRKTSAAYTPMVMCTMAMPERSFFGKHFTKLYRGAK